MIIYKILRTEEFLELETSGSSDGSVVDRQDGFVHFSTKKQLSRTLEKHFYKENNLILMAIDSKTVLKNLNWEKSYRNQWFPHLYSKLNFDDALWFAPIEFIDNRHIVPSGF